MPSKKPIYHHFCNDAEKLAEIEMSSLLKGRAPKHTFQSDFPTVKAYDGPLPEGRKGVEFTTDVAPDANCIPEKPRWRWIGKQTRAGITYERIGDDDSAVIQITVLKIQRE